MERWRTTWDGLVLKTRAFFRRHWQQALKVRERFRVSEETFHLVLAGAVGLIGGITNRLFYLITEAIKTYAWRTSGDPAEVAEVLPIWLRIIGPAVGGLLAGGILYWGLKLVRYQSTANLLEVVVIGDGKLRFRSAIVKALSSVMSISSGASIGREGAISNLTATLASKWGQLAEWHPYRLRLLVACGAASGISAAYNAPIAGAVFASSIVLGNFSMNLFAPLVFSSVVASMVSRTFFGLEPWYTIPDFNFTSVTQLPWFLIFGLIAGAFGAMFLKMLKRTEDFFKEMKVPIYGKLALAGLIVGLIAVEFPGAWGNGYRITSKILGGDYAGAEFNFLIGLFLAKLVATTVTVGSGTVGGVMTPTLFLGASLGAGFAGLLHWTGVAENLPVSTFAVTGMGAVLAATTHSPLLAMILIFEISLNYSLMPALMLTCVISTLVARKLNKDSVYADSLKVKNVLDQRENARPGLATEQSVANLMRDPVQPVRDNATLQQIASRFLVSSNNFLPVVDSEQRLMGVVALQDLKAYLNGGFELNAVIALDVMRPPPPCLTPNQTLSEALPVLLASEQRNVPVVTTLKENRLIGSVVRSEALGLLSEAIASDFSTPKG